MRRTLRTNSFLWYLSLSLWAVFYRVNKMVLYGSLISSQSFNDPSVKSQIYRLHKPYNTAPFKYSIYR